MELKDKVAVVTGAGRGIGRAVAFAMAREGASIVLNDIEGEASYEVAREIDKIGPVKTCVADVATMKGAERTIQSAVDNFGKLDVLVNNAGISRRAYVWEMEEEAWDEVIRVNLKSVFACTKFAAPVMISQRNGRIINLSSNAGRAGNAKSSNYSASKAGVIGFTKACARELAPYNVLVNAITPIAETAMYKTASEEFQRWLLESVPLGRIAKPEEVAAMVVFLASDKASYSTGQVFDVAGGRYM